MNTKRGRKFRARGGREGGKVPVERGVAHDPRCIADISTHFV